MKTLALVLLNFFIFCLISNGQDPYKIAESEVNKQDLQIALEFATQFMNKSKSGEYYQFKDEAIDAVKNQLTKENQKAVYQQLKNMFGDYKSLAYAETWKQGPVQIYRFKSDFEKSPGKLEVRVVLNDEKKIGGLWIMPWSDTFK